MLGDQETGEHIEPAVEVGERPRDLWPRDLIEIEQRYLQILARTQRGICGEDVDELVHAGAEQSVSRAEVVGAYLAAQNLREPFYPKETALMEERMLVCDDGRTLTCSQELQDYGK